MLNWHPSAHAQIMAFTVILCDCNVPHELNKSCRKSVLCVVHYISIYSYKLDPVKKQWKIFVPFTKVVQAVHKILIPVASPYIQYSLMPICYVCYFRHGCFL